jgi:HK97 family phage major capsid protein
MTNTVELLTKIDKGVERLAAEYGARLDALETATRQRRVGLVTGNPGSTPGSGFSFAKAFLAAHCAKDGKADLIKSFGLDREWNEISNATRKAIDSGTAGAGGGYVVPQHYVNELIPLIRAKSVAARLGVTMLTGLQGSPVRIPKQIGAGTVYWLGQNASIPPSEASFGEIQLTPKTMAARVQFSNLLGILSNPGIEDLIRDDFARVYALELDRVIFYGQGASEEPMGLVGRSNILTLSLGDNGGRLDFDRLTDALGMLDDADTLDGKIGVVTHPKVKRLLKKTRIPQYSGDTAGAYPVLPILSDKKLEELIGYPIATSTQIKTDHTQGGGSNLADVFCANWADVIVGLWGNLEILATNVGGTAWEQNAVQVRMVANVDVAVRREQSVLHIADAMTV